MLRFLFFAMAVLVIPLDVEATAMDDYLHRVDEEYAWHVADQRSDGGAEVYLLRLTSQRWKGQLWCHDLVIAVPRKPQYTTSLLMVVGDRKNEPPLPPADSPVVAIARNTDSVVAMVRQVPCQPLVFEDEWDPRYREAGRREDALIAYTWRKYLDGGDEEWPLQLPMTKAVSQAMTAVQEFVASLDIGASVQGFVVSGRSKRGWVSWTSAACDKRVCAVVPMVIDMLNLKQSYQHHLCSYGFFSPAVNDYVDIDLPERWDEPRFRCLMDSIEPYSYVDRLSIPKLIVNSVGDEFFACDSSHHYFPFLEGAKLLRYIPNTDHSLRNSDSLDTLAAYYRAILEKRKLPEIRWSVEDGSLLVMVDTTPLKVLVWSAENAQRRDFRMSQIGGIWKSAPLNPCSEGCYKVGLDAPKQGFRAYLVELHFEGGYTFTSEVVVVPDVLPFTR